MIKYVVIITGLVTGSISCHAASFDCHKASKADELTVCFTPELSALDDLIGQAYKNVRRISGPDQYKYIAEEFIKARNACDSNKACITSEYTSTLEEYVTLGSNIPIPAWVDQYSIAIGAVPIGIGQCSQTTIQHIEPRLEDPSIPVTPQDYDNGTAVVFANGGYQVSYNREPAILNSQPGDVVMQCLISKPEGCPPGDTRGKMYTVTDMRTYQSWTLPDSEHECGGA